MDDTTYEFLIALLCGYLCTSAGTNFSRMWYLWLIGFVAMATLPYRFPFTNPRFDPVFPLIAPSFPPAPVVGCYFIGVIIAVAYHGISDKVWLWNLRD